MMIVGCDLPGCPMLRFLKGGIPRSSSRVGFLAGCCSAFVHGVHR